MKLIKSISELLVNDKKLILDNVHLEDQPNKVYTVTLFKGKESNSKSTFIIYPFSLAFYLSLINEEQIIFNCDSPCNNYIFFTGILNRLFSLIENNDPELFSSKLDSIFFVCLKWFKEYVNKKEFPRVFDTPGIELVACKYCLKQFGSKKLIRDNFLCLRCSGKYSKYINEIFGCFLKSKVDIPSLRVSMSCEKYLRDDIKKIEEFKISLNNNIDLIAQHFYSRITRTKSPIYKDTYKSYEEKKLIKLQPTQSYPVEQKLLAELNNNDNELKSMSKLPAYKVLKVLDRYLAQP